MSLFHFQFVAVASGEEIYSRRMGPMGFDVDHLVAVGCSPAPACTDLAKS